jgi:hypothetical protein
MKLTHNFHNKEEVNRLSGYRNGKHNEIIQPYSEGAKIVKNKMF